MWRGFRWLALAGAVAVAALVGPPAALACDHSGSAVSIYVDCGPPSAGGTHHSGGGKSGGTPSTGGSQQTSITPRVSQKEQHALKHAGPDKRVLTNLLENPNLVAQPLKATLTSSPTTLGSAFDLGSGPTTLLVLLLGTVLSLLGTSGFRAWRNRHRA
jgi:hypothetical protein